MNVKKLEELADNLQKYRPTKELGFYMGDWCVDIADKTKDLLYLPERLQECGTAACALGTAIIKGWIPGAKHEFGRFDNGGTFNNWLYKGTECDIEDIAVEALWLTDLQFDYLFMPFSYQKNSDDVTAKDVADHIRQLISGEAPSNLYEFDEQEKLRRAAKRKAKKQAA